MNSKIRLTVSFLNNLKPNHTNTPRNDHAIVYSITSVNFIPDIPSRNLPTNSTTSTRSDSNAMIQYRYY
ncbi:hypothetical protein AB6C98_01510 [Vibrio splendidus]